MKTWILIFILATFSAVMAGCNLFRAPDVAAPSKPRILSGLSSSLCEGISSAELCGRVSVSLKKAGQQTEWTYWKAGSGSMNDQPSPEFVVSAEWDMRITKGIPFIGSNGGETARDEGFPSGKAQFAVVPDNARSFVPSHISEVSGLEYKADVLADLIYNGTVFFREYQNPLVNTIGPGLLKAYNMATHEVSLSQRIFILRTTDGNSHFAIRFSEFFKADKVLIFDWRKLL